MSAVGVTDYRTRVDCNINKLKYSINELIFFNPVSHNFAPVPRWLTNLTGNDWLAPKNKILKKYGGRSTSHTKTTKNTNCEEARPKKELRHDTLSGETERLKRKKKNNSKYYEINYADPAEYRDSSNRLRRRRSDSNCADTESGQRQTELTQNRWTDSELDTWPTPQFDWLD